jgi:hypothetical protein
MMNNRELPSASDERPEGAGLAAPVGPVPGDSAQQFLDNRVLGWTFIAFVSLLAACIVFAFVYFIVVSLASPSFLNDYLLNRPDIPAQMTVSLEYDSRTMKTMGVQIAFGFLVGLLFAGFGVLLFAIGANGAMQMKSGAKWLPVTLSASAPGLAVLILGGLIIALAVSKDVRRNMSAEMHLPGSASDSGESKQEVSTPPDDAHAKPRTEAE